ncbi:MAG TPA: hypothetical protein VFD23_06195 [Clostridia bacterium]|nr:hypothetical protein [Clostridia bacterium]
MPEYSLTVCELKHKQIDKRQDITEDKVTTLAEIVNKSEKNSATILEMLKQQKKDIERNECDIKTSGAHIDVLRTKSGSYWDKGMTFIVGAVIAYFVSWFLNR